MTSARGRPPLAKEDKHTWRVQVGFTANEQRAVRDFAVKLELPIAQAIRRIVILAMRRHRDERNAQHYNGVAQPDVASKLERERIVDKHIARGVLRREQRDRALYACGATRERLAEADAYWASLPEDRRG